MTQPKAFSEVGALLATPTRWPEWLAKHPEHATSLATAYSQVVRLESHTGWPTARLLDALGCTVEVEDEPLSADRLERCLGYMRWVETLVSELDLALDKRLTVAGASRFFVCAGRNLETCLDAMSWSDFPPIEYLKLGEVSQAWDLAYCVLDSPRGARARMTFEENPFIDGAAPHISPKRLEMLIDADRRSRLLGARTSTRMLEHIDSCHACQAALQTLSREESEAELPVAV
jgi:hypothetical protein